MKVVGVKTKVGYKTLDINKKAVDARNASVAGSKNFVLNFRGILFRPIRQVTHLGLVLMILVVLLTGIPTPKTLSDVKHATVDPFGIQAMTQTTDASEKVTASDAVASIVSVIDVDPENKMAKDAYAFADQQASKTSLAVTGNSIAKLASIETISSAKGKASASKYVVQNGETLWSIARDFGVTTDAIKWSNGISNADFVKPGTVLYVPSINGILYTVKSGDSIAGIASRYKAQASMLSAQNDLVSDEDLVAGMQIIVPDGVIQDAPAPTPAPRTQIATSRGSVPSYVPRSSGPNRFPWGYCTWYVASRRYIPWNGNAWQWYGNSRAYGRPTGRTPVAGAVMVTWESSVGHVAYVESVNGNSFTVSEMNYVGYGRVSRRTITTSSVPLIGFIY